MYFDDILIIENNIGNEVSVFISMMDAYKGGMYVYRE